MASDLSNAIAFKDLEALKEGLAAGADAGAPPFEGGRPPLHSCVERGWADGAAALIAAGASLDTKTPRGDSALMWACIHREWDLIELLIDAGADLETTNALGNTPLAYLCRLGAGAQGTVTVTSFEIVDGVRRELPPPAPDPQRSYVALAKLVLSKGAKVDAAGPDGRTALLYAINQGGAEFVPVLLDAGANIGQADGSGFQPIHAACSSGDLATAQLLLERGADASARDQSGFTPLHDAAAAGNLELAQLLLKHGADRTVRITEGWKDIKEGMTPFEVASLRGHAALVELLR